MASQSVNLRTRRFENLDFESPESILEYLEAKKASTVMEIDPGIHFGSLNGHKPTEIQLIERKLTQFGRK